MADREFARISQVDRACKIIVRRHRAHQAFDEIVRREPYSVEKKSSQILDRLRRGGITRFLLLFRGSRTRSELVATFMAVLELCKNHLIRLAGSSADCTVTFEGGEAEK